MKAALGHLGRGSVCAIGAALLLFCLASEVGAHPLSQGSLHLTVRPDSVTMDVRVTQEEVAVTNSATTPGGDLPGPWAAQSLSQYEQHAAYLASHLHVLADGVALPGGVGSVNPPDDPSAGTSFATYQLVYPFPSNTKPHRLELRTDVLTDGQFAPGGSWETSYVVSVTCENRSAVEGLLLTRTHPVTCSSDGARGGQTSRGQIFKDYVVHGIHHILTGYDHLLFVGALVLGAASLWDLVKVVSVFTLAHTITLTLAALNLIHLPERVVEPLISASIVFVAIQNVFWPERSRGGWRLAAAFFFGLFHGLGFAGGLLDAMREMQTTTVLLAILSFSIGVETGHQMVVLPLFFGLRLSRQVRADEAARHRMWLATQRFGSAAISLAGLFYLFVALRPTLAAISP